MRSILDVCRILARLVLGDGVAGILGQQFRESLYLLAGTDGDTGRRSADCERVTHTWKIMDG